MLVCKHLFQINIYYNCETNSNNKMDSPTKIVFLVAIFLCMSKDTRSLQITDGQSSGHLTGQALVELGNKLDKPLLRLIGKSLINVEEELKEDAESSKAEIIEEMCRLHPCSEWSEWSKCDATKLGEFGGQPRSRNCGFNTTLCKRYAESSADYEYRVCEFTCPTDYIVSQHGFCLKLYASDKKKRDDAEAACQSDGGHLVNIDSMEKVHDVNATLSEQSYSADSLWIDGRRTVQGGSWKFGYESADPTFTFWGDNDPDNGPNDLCMQYHTASYTNYYWRKFDYLCTESLGFVCEIIV